MLLYFSFFHPSRIFRLALFSRFGEAGWPPRFIMTRLFPNEIGQNISIAGRRVDWHVYEEETTEKL